MATSRIEVQLLSDTTFAASTADDPAVDIELQHDSYGLPVLSARALKGLLVEGCAGVLHALGSEDWAREAAWLFGEPGATRSRGHLYLADATLPAPVCAVVQKAVRDHHLDPRDVLGSLTAIRRQTQIAPDGTAADHTLRASRVLLRGLTLISEVEWADEPSRQAVTLLVLAALNVRRAGVLRNRGRGRVALRYRDESGRHGTESLFGRWLDDAGFDLPADLAGARHHS